MNSPACYYGKIYFPKGRNDDVAALHNVSSTAACTANGALSNMAEVNNTLQCLLQKKFVGEFDLLVNHLSCSILGHSVNKIELARVKDAIRSGG